MAEPLDIPAWITLFIGLYALAAGVGAFRTADYWASMMSDFDRQPALRFLTGFVVLALGAAIYLVNPWRPEDWLSIAVTIVGGIMVAEGLLLLAAGDRFVGVARKMIGKADGLWAGLSALIGMALILIALARL